MQTEPRAETEKTPNVWPFFAALPVSLLMAIALTPQLGGEVEYLLSYVFLTLCAFGYLVVGKKMKRKAYVYLSIGMVFLNPTLPIFMVSLYEAASIQK